MYHSVWLEEREMHLHRFLWRDSTDEEISEYAITRVNMGDKPAGCIAQLAMRETARLPIFAHMAEERGVLIVMWTTSYLPNSLKQLDKVTAGVEEILRAGGSPGILEPWLRSGQSGRPGAAAEILGSGKNNGKKSDRDPPKPDKG